MKPFSCTWNRRSVDMIVHSQWSGSHQASIGDRYDGDFNGPKYSGTGTCKFADGR